MTVEFLTGAWPLLVVRVAGRDDDASILALLDGLERHLARSRCAVVLDTTGIIYPTLGEAQRWTRQEGAWLTAHRDLVERNVCGRAKVRRVNRADGEIITPDQILAAMRED